jgi:hypothetical protein
VTLLGNYKSSIQVATKRTVQVNVKMTEEDFRLLRKAAEKRWPEAVMTNSGIVLGLARIAARQTLGRSKVSARTRCPLLLASIAIECPLLHKIIAADWQRNSSPPIQPHSPLLRLSTDPPNATLAPEGLRRARIRLGRSGSGALPVRGRCTYVVNYKGRALF